MANKTINLQTSKKDIFAGLSDTYIDISLKASRTGGKMCVGKNVDVSAVKNSIRNIFTWIRGERVLDPEFGTEISKLLYEPINTYTSEKIVAEIKSAVSKYEPRAEIDKVYANNTIDDVEHNTIELEVVWHVTGLPHVKYRDVFII